MKYRRYMSEEVVGLTRTAIHAFMLRDMEQFTAYLDESFTFVADDAPMFLVGKGQLLASIQQAHMFDPPAPGEAAPAPQPVPEEVRRGYRDLDGHIRYLSDGEILFFRSDGKLCWVCSAGQAPFPVRSDLGNVEHTGFLRIHRSYVVNLRYVRNIRRYRATLTDDRELPIGQGGICLSSARWPENMVR